MKIEINNKASIANKYIRFLKWRLFKSKERFDGLKRAIVYVKSEGKSKKEYVLTVKLWIGSEMIVLKRKSNELNKLLKNIVESIDVAVAKNKFRLTAYPVYSKK